MHDTERPAPSGKKHLIAVLATTGLLLGGGAVGAVGVAAADAAPHLTAATPAPSASSSGTTSHERGHHGDETAVTGAKATTLKAAALKAVPGGTVLRVETDSDGAAYEVHVKKSDGTHVTVKFDSALKQTAIETNTGKGGHGRGHGNDRSTTAE